MISASVRKSFTYLLPGAGTIYFQRGFHASLALSLRLSSNSTKSKGRPVGTPTISELLRDGDATPDRSKSILLFLKENGFSDTQLELMIRGMPKLLSANLERTIIPVFKIFQDWGFSISETAEIITKEPNVLRNSTSNRLVPSLTALKGLLGSNEEMFKVLRKCGWFLTEDIDKRVWPNVKFLKSCGIPMEHILLFLTRHPTGLFIRPGLVREHVEKLNALGFDPNSKMYIHALRVVVGLTDELWELKVQTFRDLGFSETDILTSFRKAPQVFGGSVKKIRRMVEVICATKRYSIASIVANPMSLRYSLDKRMMPRLQFLDSLYKKNLIKEWPSLASVYLYSDQKFYKKYAALLSK